MNLENNIKDAITLKLEDGTIEKIVQEELEKGVAKALGNLFSSYGDVTKVIEGKVKEVMIPYLENYNYSKYITKLDSVLIKVLESAALDNKKLLENFKELIQVKDKIKTIKLSEVYEKWMEYVKENVSTSDLEVVFEDGVHYEDVSVDMTVEYDEGRSWLSFKCANVFFACKEDEEMNFALRLSKYSKIKEEWNIEYKSIQDINSLRYLNEFELFIMQLRQNGVEVEIDTDYESDEITPEAEPEASFS